MGMSHQIPDAHRDPSCFCSRRDALRRLGGGFGSLAFASLLGNKGLLSANAAVTNPMAPKLSHIAPKARSVIWLFQEGGPSGFDLFDHKPALNKFDGTPIPGVDPFFGQPGPIMQSPYKFNQHGESGAWVSSAMPHITECVDDIAFLKAVHCESNSHAPAMYQMNTGFTRPGFPSAGSWITYGLGSESDNLPGFVVLPKLTGTKGGALNWSAGFLPGAYQGTLFRGGENPILNLKRAKGLTQDQQRAQLDLLRQMNEEHLAMHPAESDLEARINSFELAYRMQFEASDVVDLNQESKATREMYGMGDEMTHDYGSKLLMARRLVERGVRFVQAYPSDQWDAHQHLKDNHDRLCRLTDQPVAALLKDLKRRGMLDTTLVIWGGEFGRLPVTQGQKGRDHNPYGFLMWMAGGGVRGGASYGQTDELGYKTADEGVSVQDVHATILHLMGMNHKELAYMHNGRDFRLTDVSGEVITPILA